VVPGNFAVCWNCGADETGLGDPRFRPAVVRSESERRCEACGYLLYGLEENRCPECGRHFERVKKDTPPAVPRKRAWRGWSWWMRHPFG